MTHTFWPVCAFGPLVGSDRSVPLYSAATVAWAFVTPEDVDAAPDPDVVPAGADALVVGDASLLLLPVLPLLPQAATAPQTAATAAIVPMRLRILHTPFSIDLLLRPVSSLTRPSSGKPNPPLLSAVLVQRCVDAPGPRGARVLGSAGQADAGAYVIV